MTTATKVKKPLASWMENPFAGQAKKPTEKAVAAVLGPSLPLWHELIEDLQRDLKIDTAEWHSAYVKYGWSLRLQLKKRNIVYLGPRTGWFLAAFALGDKAIAAARNANLTASVLKTIAEAKRYPEGTAVRIEVRTPEDAAAVKVLAKIKIEN
ncbi:MAG TPA: DUF3788 family protein [Candidatus Sulfotelmatobacter sp.]|nr:DUF3788 family protein [Candidatus Sulfotelmatobacter sp.]